jgi:very-short-patch-repair endonuclease
LKLIIEIDGKHHQSVDAREHDARRDRWLAEQGYEVVRIPGYRVSQDASLVRDQIEHAVDERITHRDRSLPQPFSPNTIGESGD